MSTNGNSRRILVAELESTVTVAAEEQVTIAEATAIRGGYARLPKPLPWPFPSPTGPTFPDPIGPWPTFPRPLKF